MADKNKENENGGEKQDEAKLKLVNAVVDPSDEQLSSMTVIPRVMAVPLAVMETYDEALNPDRTESLSKIFIRKLKQLNRSINGRILERSCILAKTQIESEAEEEEGEEAEDTD